MSRLPAPNLGLIARFFPRRFSSRLAPRLIARLRARLAARLATWLVAGLRTPWLFAAGLAPGLDAPWLFAAGLAPGLDAPWLVATRFVATGFCPRLIPRLDATRLHLAHARLYILRLILCPVTRGEYHRPLFPRCII